MTVARKQEGARPRSHARSQGGYDSANPLDGDWGERTAAEQAPDTPREAISGLTWVLCPSQRVQQAQGSAGHALHLLGLPAGWDPITHFLALKQPQVNAEL